MGRFDEFITGKLEMDIGGQKLELDATIKDKRKLKALYSGGTDLTEEKLERMDNVFIDILKRSYPSEDPKGMEGFYSKFDMEFMKKFFVAVGWAKEKDLETQVKQNPN